MHYENRQPPEGINVQEHGWVREFAFLVCGVVAAFLLVCWLLLQVLSWSARWIPFSWEQAITASWRPAQVDARLEYLQGLAESLAQSGGLAENLQVTVRYADRGSINALATLGGNMVVFEGLLGAVQSEQGLAFVVAHELAHIHYRHPVQALARGLGLGALMTLVFGQNSLSSVAGLGGDLALLDYSREQERQADAWALAALYSQYGHVQGAGELFAALQEQSQDSPRLPEWLSTHPELAQRLEYLRQLATERGYPLEGPLTPLPPLPRQ